MFPLVALSQNNPPQQPPSIIVQYNAFLKDIGLLNLIEVAQFNKSDSINVDPAAHGGINVLTLVVNSKYQSPIVFAKDWAAVVAKYGGEKALFEFLFSKLADYTGIPSALLQIDFNFRNTHAYEFHIFFSQGIKYKVSGIDFRDAGKEGPGDFDDSSYGGQIEGVAQTSNLKIKIRDGLQRYFKTLKHEEQIEVKVKTWDDDNLLKYEIRNVKGEITGKYNEAIYVNLFIVPGKNGQLNIYYLFTVKYLSGIYRGSENEQNYIDAVSRYDNKVTAFGINLKDRIKQYIGTK